MTELTLEQTPLARSAARWSVVSETTLLAAAALFTLFSAVALLGLGH